MSDKDEVETYILIHILPKVTGEKPQREIVPANSIKKFDYQVYKENKNIYKETKFNYKRGPDGQKYQCYILYAANSYNAVYTKSLSRRFSIPTHSTTLTEDDTSSDVQVQHADEIGNIETKENEEHVSLESKKKKAIVSKAKRNLKEIKQQKKKHKSDREEDILENYMNQQQNDSSEVEENYNEEELNFLTEATSTPLKDATNAPKQIETIANLTRQAMQYKNFYIDQRRENEKLKNMLEDLQNSTSQHSHPNEIEAESNNDHHKSFSKDNEFYRSKVNPFLNYDEVYSYHPNEQLVRDEFGNILLPHGIPCNPKAYNDSWKVKTPSKCLAILSQGVYELQDLAERCVRKQSNTMDKKVLDPLKTVALEKQVYKFMRTKNLKIEDVEYFLRNLNTIHHQCINKAKRRYKTLQSFHQNVNDDEYMDCRGPLTN